MPSRRVRPSGMRLNMDGVPIRCTSLEGSDDPANPRVAPEPDEHVCRADRPIVFPYSQLRIGHLALGRSPSVARALGVWDGPPHDPGADPECPRPGREYAADGDPV